MSNEMEALPTWLRRRADMHTASADALPEDAPPIRLREAANEIERLEHECNEVCKELEHLLAQTVCQSCGYSRVEPCGCGHNDV